MFRHYSFVIFVCVIISAFVITYDAEPEAEIHDDVTIQETVKSVELKPKYLEIQAGEILIKKSADVNKPADSSKLNIF